jgi:hypothetical protein
MGMPQVTVRVERPDDPERFFSEKLWVDTRTLYTFIPEDRLHALEIEPRYSRGLVLVDGRRERRLLGEAGLSIEQLGESITCPVIFAPQGSPYLLGATALEAFGVEVDPTTKRLRPFLGIIGGFTASAGADGSQAL